MLNYNINGYFLLWESRYLEQELAQGHKGGPVVWFLSPALQHHVVDVLRTVLGLREALPFFIDLVQNLLKTLKREEQLVRV